MGEKITARNYKDSVFIKLFNERRKIIELYNALAETTYDEKTKVEIQTIENILYGPFKNDMAFEIDDKFVVLVEHQSTICNNMPLRMLLYLSRIYEKIVDISVVYRTKLIRIPYPEMYVLYNGKEDYPEESEMKLSDSFMIEGNNVSLELIVKVLNINYEKGATILKECTTLEGYSYFIYTIRQNENKGMSRDEAIKSAIEKCISMGVLKDFLLNYGSEVHNMLFAEYDREEELRIAREEAREDALEEGKKEGIEEGIEKVAKEMLRRGSQIELVSGITKLSRKRVLELQQEVKNGSD